MPGPYANVGGTPRIAILGPQHPAMSKLLTPDFLAFLAPLAQKYTPATQELLARRKTQQARFDAGQKPHFLPQTRSIREGKWQCAPQPKDLLDRRVEMTGPTSTKMVINALNSGARTFMADFEDSNCPTFSNMLEGQMNMIGAVQRDLQFTDRKTGKKYALKDQIATLIVRPRGWHLWEKHVLVEGQPVPGGLFDFAVFFFHNAKTLLSKGSGTYFYLPKMQHHLEARLWNDIFVDAQDVLDVPQGSIKATVLIETLPAAFQMHEILYELREHSSGLNCGRWDYIFSFIKTLRADPEAALPDRSEVGMTQHCMRSYTQLLIQTCHRRGVHAMGGMAAQIPIKDDPAANKAAMDKVVTDKQREVKDGHDGTWIAHPALLPFAQKEFDEYMPKANQLERMREDVAVTAEDLLSVPQGNKTEAGLRLNISVGLMYLEAWLGGNGCIPIHNMMEDAATAEIAHTQVWQWIKHGAALQPAGKPLTVERFFEVQREELSKIRSQLGAARYDGGHWAEAAELFGGMATAPECADFLTLPAYEAITRRVLATSRI